MEWIFVIPFNIVLIIIIIVLIRKKPPDIIISKKNIVEYINNEMSEDDLFKIGLRLINSTDYRRITPWLKKWYKKIITNKFMEF